jgi:hypothetical protein
MFGMREFFKRLYAMFLAEGLDPVIFTHSTDTVMPAAYAFVGVTMNGENAPVTPQTGKYYDEVWQPENLQVQSCPEHWGFMTIVMPLMQGTWPPDGQGVTSLHRQEISAAAWFFLHDTESHYTHHAYTVGWPLGLDTNACAAASFDRTQPADFLPYWEDATRKLAWAAKPDVLIGGYRQDRTYVFGVFNRSREALRNEPVHADLQRLFGERDVKPRVLLNGKLVEAAIEGDMLKVTVTLDPHVYALLKIVR